MFKNKIDLAGYKFIYRKFKISMFSGSKCEVFYVERSMHGEKLQFSDNSCQNSCKLYKNT